MKETVLTSKLFIVFCCGKWMCIYFSGWPKLNTFCGRKIWEGKLFGKTLKAYKFLISMKNSALEYMTDVGSLALTPDQESGREKRGS